MLNILWPVFIIISIVYAIFSGNIENLNKEIEVLLGYLPEQLTEDEIQKIVEETIAEIGASTMKDMGKVMGAVSSKVRGRADNRVVSGFVKSLLSK